MLYYFSEANFRGNHAGTKARNDVDTILKKFGARPFNTHVLELRSNQDESIYSNIHNRLGFIRYYLDLLRLKNQTVIIQYPMLAFDIAYQYVEKLSRRNKVIFLVHDIQSLRHEGFSGLEAEIKLLNLAHSLIVHNRFMRDKLIELNLSAERMYCLECFDYLYDGDDFLCSVKNSVCFAGNLGKAMFLSQLLKQNSNLSFNLYGPGWNDTLSQNDNAHYCGSFSPDIIPGKLDGQYGLIWDGTTTAGCSGVLGEYTKINNPHKMSLYIAAGIPVIAWSDAAVSEFIRRYDIGITVECIDTLQETIADISVEKYIEMKKNVMLLRDRVISGGFLTSVLAQISKEIPD